MVRNPTSKLQSNPQRDCMIKYGTIAKRYAKIRVLFLLFISLDIRYAKMNRHILKMAAGNLIMILLIPKIFISIMVR